MSLKYKAFEYTLPEFDGSTDETDDKVIWVAAESQEKADEIMTANYLEFNSLGQMVDVVVETNIDSFDHIQQTS